LNNNNEDEFQNQPSYQSQTSRDHRDPKINSQQEYYPRNNIPNNKSKLLTGGSANTKKTLKEEDLLNSENSLRFTEDDNEVVIQSQRDYFKEIDQKSKQKKNNSTTKFSHY